MLFYFVYECGFLLSCSCGKGNGGLIDHLCSLNSMIQYGRLATSTSVPLKIVRKLRTRCLTDMPRVFQAAKDAAGV